MILESVKHGPLIWHTIEKNGATRTKKYAELSATEKIQADCDLKATNIILQGLPSDIYSLVKHHRVAKDLWERIQLLMQGTTLTKQERKCKLYDAFDKFAHIKGESLHQYYLRFTQLINDINIYKMKLEQFQVNTKFLNSLSPEWKYDDLYKDVNVRSKVAEHEEVGKGDVEMTNVTRESGSQEKSYEQVVEDAHVTLTTSQKTEGSKQSSSVSSDFAIPVTAIPETSTVPATTVPPAIQHQQSTPTPEPTTEPSTTLIPALPDFSSLFGFDHRVSTLETELSQLKQKAQEEKDRYIDLVEKYIKDIIKDEVKSQLLQILPKEVSDFATHVIQSAINESLENVILAKSSSQPKSIYEAATSLIEELYKALVKSYKLNKDLFDSYGNTYSLKRDRDDRDKDEDPSARSDRGLKKRKTSKDVEPTKGPKTKESKSISSKGTKSQLKSSGKSAQAEEPEFEVADSDMPQNQEGNLGNDDEEPMREVASKRDWFTKPKQPQEPTDPDWNVSKNPQQGPTQSWLMTLASTADKPSKTFDELMSTPIDFSAYIMNGLKITNLTQETLLGPAFKLLKGTRTNFAELEYDFEECYKALSEKLD
ncbi:hypothetical protein Tco_0986265 [Tanacetum coccineum]